MYQLFQRKMSPYIVFSIKDIEKEFASFDKKALVYWQKKDFLIKIRNGYYCFSEIERNELFLYYVGNKIYSPSYISLETALAYYHVIPEGVFSTTGITTLKTSDFTTPVGCFEYKHVKPSLFFGYQLISFKNKKIKLAKIEKTILDYIYLHANLNQVDDFSALRWNKEILNQIDFQLLQNYQLLFNSKALNKRVKQFINYLHA